MTCDKSQVKEGRSCKVQHSEPVSSAGSLNIVKNHCKGILLTIAIPDCQGVKFQCCMNC